MFQNKFLNDFILTQQKMIHSETEKKDKKKQIKSRHGTADGKRAGGGDEFALLVEEKPGKQRVLDYFKDRIAELTAEEINN